jgi:hypothetical protein
MSLSPQIKSKSITASSRVGALIKKTNSINKGYKKRLEPDEKILSFNKVTGYSVNFPISETCLPSEVCASRCYFAAGPATWPNSLKKQLRLYNSVKHNPAAIAEKLAKEVKRKQKSITYIRWNGGGDLFLESVSMIHHFAKLLPSLPLWIVTRNPEFAAMLEDRANIFIHFSLDLKSMDRLEKFEKNKKKSSNYFYSYQCDKDETPKIKNLEKVSVLFFDCYKPSSLSKIKKSIICPLNLQEDITGVCERCRRCFDDSAVIHRTL